MLPYHQAIFWNRNKGKSLKRSAKLMRWFQGDLPEPLTENQWVISLESQHLQGLAPEVIGTRPVLGF